MIAQTEMYPGEIPKLEVSKPLDKSFRIHSALPQESLNGLPPSLFGGLCVLQLPSEKRLKAPL